MTTEEISKDRSPRAPVIPLEDAISHLRKLQGQIGRSPVGLDVACRALGYSGKTGSSLTLIAGLSQYGLVDRDKGNVAIAATSLRILHPTSNEQLQKGIREAALAPKVFADLYAGYNQCSEEVLKAHLIQNGFSPERAKQVAAVYTANKAFAKLDDDGTQVEEKEGADEPQKQQQPISETRNETASLQKPPAGLVDPLAGYNSAPSLVPTGQKMLAQYTIPLGPNQATLVFTGQELTPDDFDALVDFVQFSKRQFERAQAAIAISRQRSTDGRFYPAQATWKNKDHDMPVTIVAKMGEKDGRVFYQSSTGTGIPGDELIFLPPE